MHIDIDSFFVSAERKINPSLKGKAVAIASKGENSIAVSLSYEAKQRGAKVPWLVKEIKKIIPDIIIVNPKHELYSSESQFFFDFLAKLITYKIEPLSVDECFVDVTEFSKKFSTKEKMGEFVKKQIMDKLQLPVSVGISHNKLLAKMATNQAKPFGVKFISKEMIATDILPLEIHKYYGIGKRTAEFLVSQDIKTVNDFLLKAPKNPVLMKKMGKKILDVIDDLTSTGNDFVDYKAHDPKSISQQVTFEANKEITERTVALEYLKSICLNLSNKLKRQLMITNYVGLSIFNSNKAPLSKKIKLPKETNDFEIIYKSVLKLFDFLWEEQKIKSLLVFFPELKKETYVTRAIFDEDKDYTKEKELILKVNETIGHRALMSVSDFQKEKQKSKVVKRFFKS
ncbi:Y-family DNA polymerase [Mycoplasma procyoni]|uniref:Y-family DNA polymerase n=1 Tax=Mycoplasma procyoni TaxID=568784 RepID=UPI00197C4CE6|nr:hypothetical protein [Mycoplasma procyoni]MBN3535076.1 hypothetical protein [Mycoplasma procyoni]